MTVDALPSGLFEFPDPPSRHQPNHLNDLTNRDWMLFSKSFFRYEGDQALVDGMLNFFTKKLGSVSLIIGALHTDCYCCLLVEEPPKGFPMAVSGRRCHGWGSLDPRLSREPAAARQ